MDVSEQQAAAEEKIADLIFGAEESEEPQEAEKEADQDEYEPDPKPQVEGAESDDEDAEVVEAKEGDEFVEIEIDGEILEVPEKYKDYFLRQQDYTKKTQELSEQRREFEVRQQQLSEQQKLYEFQSSVADEVSQAQQLQYGIQQLKSYLSEQIDALSSKDIEKVRLQIDNAKDQYEQIVSGLHQKQQEFQQSQEQSRKELLKKGTEVLRTKVPEWSEETMGKAKEYAASLGIPAARVDSN